MDAPHARGVTLALAALREHIVARSNFKSGMRKSVGTFPPASRSNLLESITFMILDLFDPQAP
jgi:hypothetical protein